MSDMEENKRTFVLGVEIGFRAAIHILNFSATEGNADERHDDADKHHKMVMLIMAEALEKHAEKVIENLAKGFDDLQGGTGGDE